MEKISWLQSIKLFALIVLSFTFSSCGIFFKGVPPPPTPLSWENEMEGYASWYGEEYHGKRTASGEIYNMYALTAAHRTLPFESEVRVHNLENGKTVDVRINDRGPFIENRIVDLSYSSAKAIDMINQGVVKVKLSLIKQPVSAETSGYILQAGSFLVLENAIQLKRSLESIYSPILIETFETNSGKYHRVRLGPFKSRDTAMKMMSKLRRKNIQPYLISAY